MAAFLLDNTNIELEINALNVERRTALDELLRAQYDLGYFGLKSMLHRKGAKTARALRRIPYQRKGTSLYRKRLQRMEAPLLVFATLVATVTYQAVFNPPGGVWNDDYPPPSPVKGRDDTRQHHKAGKPILLSEKPLHYHMFNLFNNVAFFASWTTIVGIVTGKRLQIPHVLYSETIVLVSWIVAYLLAVSSISLVSLYYTTGVLIFLIFWAFCVRFK